MNLRPGKNPYDDEMLRLARLRQIARERQEEEDAAREWAEYRANQARFPVKPRPGHHNAAAAAKAGREDEYIDAMKNRYGGEW